MSGAEGIWTIDQKDAPPSGKSNRILPFLSTYTSYKADVDTLRSSLARMVKQSVAGDLSGAKEFDVPMPDGTIQRFRIVNAPILSPALQKLSPVQTYAGYGVDDPHARVRLDFGPNGFHGFVMSPHGDVFIEPFSQGDQSKVFSYFRRDNLEPSAMHCATVGLAPETINLVRPRVGSTLKTYRLAMNATTEYTAVFGNAANAENAMITSVNRVVGVYENDLAISMVIVYKKCWEASAGADPFTNTNGGTMLGQNQTNLDATVGNANYDIGHVFSTGGGGIAGLRVVGITGNKARGVTGLPSPFGDGFDIDFVAHEMGHQYGGDHTFNSISGNCNGNRTSSSAYEMGSGSTIMAYAGICSVEDLQPHSDAYFHTRSWDQITAWRNSAGSGGSSTTLVNTPPTVDAGPNFTIPLNTPFKLTAVGNDVDGNPLTYCWEQFDLGASSPGASSLTGPLIRSKNPLVSPTRFFPALPTVLGGGTDQWERLPDQARAMVFRCTARDNRPGGGGSAWDNMTITVAGPQFRVTAPSSTQTWAGNSTQTITWTVGSVALSPNVNILISLNNGTSYGTGTALMVLANTPNDGTETITVPNVSSSSARVIVEASSNIFYDTADVNVTINATAAGSGNVALGNWGAGTSGMPVNFEIRNGSGTVVQTTNANLDASGNFTFPVTVAPGTYTVTAKASHWLRKAVGSVTITSTGFTGVNFTLMNGDVDGNNAVTLGDFAALRAAFGSGPGDGNWNPLADLNGDGAVTLGDFAILRANFGSSGD